MVGSGLALFRVVRVFRGHHPFRGSKALWFRPKPGLQEFVTRPPGPQKESPYAGISLDGELIGMYINHTTEYCAVDSRLGRCVMADEAPIPVRRGRGEVHH